MRKIILSVAVLACAALYAAWAFAVTPTPEVEVFFGVEVTTPEDANCNLATLTSTYGATLGRLGQSQTAMGAPTGDCNTGAITGKNFQYSFKANLRGHVDRSVLNCDKEIWVHSDRDQSKGIHGAIQNITDLSIVCTQGGVTRHFYKGYSLD